MEGDKKKPEEAGAPVAAGSTPVAANKPGGKYVPPSMRDGAAKGRGETMKSSRGKVY